MATLEQLQQHFGTDSPEEAILAASRRYGISPTEIADEVGYDMGGSKTGARLDEAGDSELASLASMGQAVAGKLGLPGVASRLDATRRRNLAAAQIEDQRAKDLGGVQSIHDIHGVSDAADYAAGAGISMVPTLGEIAAGTIATGGASDVAALVRGGMALSDAIKVAGAAAAKRGIGMEVADATPGLSATGKAVAGAASVYPSVVGQNLQVQRDAGGDTNLGAAMALGVPQAALMTAAPMERLAAAPGLMRSGIEALDSLPGVRGALARTGATAARLGLEQGAIGAASEGINQLSRMSVDPNATMTSPDALDRYSDAAIGGALLGGPLSLLGGWRRSEHAAAPVPNPVDKPGGADLLLGYDPTAGKAPYYAFPDGSSALTSEAATLELQRRARAQYAPQDADPEFQLDGSQPADVGPHDDVAQAIGGNQNPDQYELFQGDGQPTYAAEQTGDRAPRRGGLYDTPLIGQQPQGGSGAIALPPEVQRQLYQQIARKADAGHALTPTEQHLLDTYSSQPPGGSPQLALPPDRGFQLDGGPTPHFDMLSGEQRPDFHLEMQDASPPQMELDLQPPEPPQTPPQAPGTPLRANQRGFVNELPFAPPEAKIKTPIGQQLYGLAQSLTHEGIMDEGTLDQVTTLLTQNKVGTAGQIVNKAMTERAAVKSAFDKAQAQRQADIDKAQAQIEKARDQQAKANEKAQAQLPDAKDRIDNAFAVEDHRTADAVTAQIAELADQRAQLLTAAGKLPPLGTPKREKWNALTTQLDALRKEQGANRAPAAEKTSAPAAQPAAEAKPQASTLAPQDTAAKIDKYERLLECLRG
jgi:hypothetical protein